MKLRDNQVTTVEKIISSEKDIIICLPTGAGKTVIASAVIRRLNEKGKTVVFIVPRLELIKQAGNEFGNCDIIWSDKTELTGKKCIVASKDSLRTQYLKIPENSILFFDEAHIGLEQTKKLIDLIKPVCVLGLSATPERMDGKALLKGNDSLHAFGCFDELLQEETVSSLIKKGYLCPLKYYTKPIEGITEIKPDEANGQELSDSQMTEIFDKNQIWGDLVESYEKYGIENGIKRPALGFTNTVAMAQTVAALFTAKGYNFQVISGDMPVKTREELIEGLRTGKIDGLINAALLTYGFDCPPVSYAFSCRHIKSRPLWFQIVGRILRTCENKENAVFVDHGDSVSEFEDPSCSLPILDPLISWRVNGETKEEKIKRKKAQKKERDSIKLLQELDPMPCNMVEVKPEDTWERMIKCLQKLRLKKENLLKLMGNLQNEIKKQDEKNQKLEQELKENTNKKFIDKKATFEFCRTNYCFFRNMIHEQFWDSPEWKHLNWAERRMNEHEMTVKRLRIGEEKLCFLFDMKTFMNSMKYWEENYTYLG